MALDETGRPIPVSIPDPPQHSGQPTEADIQFMLMAKKSDDALRLASDLSRRVNELEKMIGDRLETKLAEFEKRFDTIMVERLSAYQRQVDAAVASYPHISPEAAVAQEH
jgi:hypothetical protein